MINQLQAASCELQARDRKTIAYSLQLIAISFLLFMFMLSAQTLYAQDFVTRAKIEYEKKIRQAKDVYPEYRVSYFDLLFAGNQAIYKAGRDNVTPMGGGPVNNRRNEDIMFSDYTTDARVSKKTYWDEDFIIEDSIPPIKWKIGQETRPIAGYQCRKAIGRIFDTVYVVAFYAEELVIKGGPEGFQGLPGMILGLAIPRYNTTWFATKVELASIDESSIIPPTLRNKKGDTRTRMIKKLEEYGMKDPKGMVDRYMKRGYFF